MQESSRWVSAQALSGFVVLSHENTKIVLPQTAKCGLERVAYEFGHLAMRAVFLEQAYFGGAFQGFEEAGGIAPSQGSN